MSAIFKLINDYDGVLFCYLPDLLYLCKLKTKPFEEDEEITIYYPAVRSGDDGKRYGDTASDERDGATNHESERRMELHRGRAGGGLLRLPHEPLRLGILPQRQASATRGSDRVRLRQGRDNAGAWRLEHARRAVVLLRRYGVAETEL